MTTDGRPNWRKDPMASTSTNGESWRQLVAGCDNIEEDRIVHFTEYLEEKSQKPAILYHSGFDEFDKKLDALATGEVTVITGKTGEGKTLFAESWMHGIMAKHDVPGCVFSWEVSPVNLLQKYKSFPKTPLYLPLKLETMNVDWLYKRVQEARNKIGCRVFLLDHLHFLVDMSVKQNMSLNIGGFMRRLKQEIALGLDVGILLIAHQKGVETGEEPSLESLRDSSFIAQEADNVIVVWRQKDYDDKEIDEIRPILPMLASEISRRMKTPIDSPHDKFGHGFEMVQIAKSRRAGTFRWKKLFQKVGPLFEEV